MSSPLRFLWIAIAAVFVLATLGAGWEIARFGTSDQAAAERLERDVRGYVGDRADAVRSLAAGVAAERPLIVAADGSRDTLASLFSRLASLAHPADRIPVTVTVYVPERAAYRVLAWSDGPADVVANNLLTGPSALLVAPGAGGLRLVFVQPVENADRRAAVVVAETVLSSVSQDEGFLVETEFGGVTVVPAYAGGTGTLVPSPGMAGFVVAGSSGTPLLEVHYSPSQLSRSRHEFRNRVLALAGLPIAIIPVLFVGRLLDYRRRARSFARWFGWSALAILNVASTGAILVGLAHLAAIPPNIGPAVVISAAVAAVAIFPGGLWWRRERRLRSLAAPLRFAIEQLVVGVAIAATVAIVAVVLSRRVTASSLASWQSTLFPFDITGLVDVWTLLLLVLALCWATAALLASVAARWRLSVGRAAGVVALAAWLLPTILELTISGPWPMPPVAGSLTIAGAAALFGLTATPLRRYYRRTTQSMRLLLGFLSLLAPLATVYPMIAAVVERTTRSVIEREYAPQTAGHPQEIHRVLGRTQEEIDRQSALAEQVRSRAGQPVDSQTAFRVWSDTTLSRTRVISDIELYGPDRALISRFTLNFPDYLYRSRTRTWQGNGCQWELSGEVTRFGASDRAMLHAQRGLCDAAGQVVGAVALHVAPTDYSALPFLSSANPYPEILGVGPAPARRTLPDLEVVVYGWSLRPLFTSSRVAWPIDAPIAQRLYRDGTAFWTELEGEGRLYRVFLLQNRLGIFALGYPKLTAFEHAARLAEIAAVTAVLFVLIQIGAVLYGLVAERRAVPLRVLLHEIRTSFYRKLFLFFVLVAVGPVFLFALAFGAYMTGKFRADVESEAETVVANARRVFEQVAAAEQPLEPLTDDLMVWIRQVIDEDVNLFDGSELVATSQRDLFNSGLLPTRTPAILYRRIALEQLPTFVAEDRQYLVAASPLPARGRDSVLSVPLASRQREIEDEVDQLARGVLVGSVAVVLFAAGLGASLASRVSDPVARLTKATRQIAAGRLDVQIAADTADELRRLVDDFNTMTSRLLAQRAELARTNQLKAWNEMAREVAHEIKNPLTPIQLAAEHLRRVHDDHGRPLGVVFDQCVQTILGQVRMLRQIASEFANFAAEHTSRSEPVPLGALLKAVVDPYRTGLTERVQFHVDAPADLPPASADRLLLSRALTNLVENAVQAMPAGGTLRLTAAATDGHLTITIADTGVGMDADAIARAFEPYFSTKTGGSGLGLANAKRNVELEGGTIALASTQGVGTTVTITLPAAALPDEPAAGSSPFR